ncbi:Tad domain-containing protein [Parerythrobacter aestuarii]|uniref:Tad domain-containing protein n=1 Tax=Parerythrobacter aestuarii TaxID=3020909 RepID=UPI0024DE958F|nr:Tad domain-containing protein [Parerythrobacter aestuarii]
MRMPSFPCTERGFLSRIARDRSGNTLALVAAAMLPLLAIVGSGVDMGRAYVVQTRLQQACDAATLAARKKLGSEVVVTGDVPAAVADVGNQFFDLNFQDTSYASYDRTFQMTLESDYSITGQASLKLPMAVMQVFGKDQMDIAVNCGSVLNFNNLDIMMSIDVTGSMRHTNPGDTMSRLDSVKAVVRNFHGQLEGAKAPTTRIRYGFVPYASNVNVGALLQDDWVTTTWNYQSREETGVTIPSVSYTEWKNWVYVSGSATDWAEESRYDAKWNPPPSPDQAGWYECDQPEPAETYSYVDTFGDPVVTTQLDPPAVVTTEPGTRVENGIRYRDRVVGNQCIVEKRVYTDYTNTFDKVTVVPSLDQTQYRYDQLTFDVSDWRTATDGCIEERKSTQLTDFSNVDLSQNLDLDINTVPTPGDPDTQWRPHYPSLIYARKISSGGSGSFFKPAVITTDNYAQTGSWWFSDCPPAASKLAERTLDELNTYLDTLVPYSATYHDIGMIWGGRLLSQNGLFAAENADVSTSQPTSRHLIFLTDGQTEPYDLAYTTYGLEPLDERRWDSSMSLTLPETIEARFKFACEEVKKNSITVWIIAFGTYANQAMKDCAGEGYYFEASDSVQLNEAFVSIAKSMGDLRISS